MKLLSAEDARAMDREAAASWGLHPHALAEAAGRNSAQVFRRVYNRVCRERFRRVPPGVGVLAGKGNNGADALVMLRSLILSEDADASRSWVVSSAPAPADSDGNPRDAAFRCLIQMGVPVRYWADMAGAVRESILGEADFIIDGLTGTGLNRPLEGALAEIAALLNRRETGGPQVLAVDLPSGIGDQWEEGMPAVRADATLALEPQKLALYKPAARPYGGTILPVEGIFPPALCGGYGGPELIHWKAVRERLPPVPPEVHKYRRGLAEIRAGSPGSAGAARIAARGAQAAGAGLVRLIVDESLYPILAASAGGVMVAVSEKDGGPAEDRFRPDAVLLGPGWGAGPDRFSVLERALEQEAAGTPLILDADAIALARSRRFHGNAILTPHPGEWARYSGLEPELIARNPLPSLARIAAETQGVVLLKGHVLLIAAPDGRLGILDGMAPVLAMGGTGDLLAGFCAAIAARMRHTGGGFDGYTCAVIAGALLMETARSRSMAGRFADPLDAADAAARIAGAAWLPESPAFII